MAEPPRRGLRPARRSGLTSPDRSASRNGRHGHPNPRPRAQEPGQAAEQASGRTPTPGFTSESSSCRNRTGSGLPELAGGSRLRASAGRSPATAALMRIRPSGSGGSATCTCITGLILCLVVDPGRFRVVRPTLRAGRLDINMATRRKHTRSSRSSRACLRPACKSGTPGPPCSRSSGSPSSRLCRTAKTAPADSTKNRAIQASSCRASLEGKGRWPLGRYRASVTRACGVLLAA